MFGKRARLGLLFDCFTVFSLVSYKLEAAALASFPNGWPMDRIAQIVSQLFSGTLASVFFEVASPLTNEWSTPKRVPLFHQRNCRP